MGGKRSPPVHCAWQCTHTHRRTHTDAHARAHTGCERGACVWPCWRCGVSAHAHAARHAHTHTTTRARAHAHRRKGRPARFAGAVARRGVTSGRWQALAAHERGRSGRCEVPSAAGLAILQQLRPTTGFIVARSKRFFRLKGWQGHASGCVASPAPLWALWSPRGPMARPMHRSLSVYIAKATRSV